MLGKGVTIVLLSAFLGGFGQEFDVVTEKSLPVNPRSSEISKEVNTNSTQKGSDLLKNKVNTTLTVGNNNTPSTTTASQPEEKDKTKYSSEVAVGQHVVGGFGQENDGLPEKSLPVNPRSSDILKEVNTNSTQKGSDLLKNEVNTTHTIGNNNTPSPETTTASQPEEKDKTKYSSEVAVGQHVVDTITVKLLEAEENGIGLSDINLNKQFIYKNHTGMKTFSIDFHFKNKYLFYVADDKIFREDYIGRTSSGNALVVHDKGVDGPVSIAVDWANDRLYWLSTRHNTVERSSLNGTERQLLIDSFSNTRYPNNIAVDPYEGHIFIVSNHTIYKASLDGTNLVDVRQDATEKRAVKYITLDTYKKRIYYTGKESHYDKGQPYLASSDYQGHDVQEIRIPKRSWNDIFSLGVFRNTLYFCHYPKSGSDSIWSVDLTEVSPNPHEVYSAGDNKGGIWSIKVLHPGLQPPR